MTRNQYLNSGIGIGLVATGLALSPRARRTLGRGIGSLGSAVSTVARTVIQGTRNLQEAEKHVTKFGVEAAGGTQPGCTASDSA